MGGIDERDGRAPAHHSAITKGPPITLLDYYRAKGISPVGQDISDLAGHFARRAALYRTLGLIPAAFRGSRVLEVAPGSGHNSLYIANLRPAEFHLVEPNPTAIATIKQLYADFSVAHTPPILHETMLETFSPAQQFDIVLCENWLGGTPAERGLMAKLGLMVAPHGVLVLTSVSPIGLVPNLLRRVLLGRILRDEDFEARTALGVEALSSHLATLAAMTRSHRDWIQDNMLNPAYFAVMISPLEACTAVGSGFAIYNSSPSFRTDWRWYKAMTGDEARFTELYSEDYWRICHNWLDYRHLAGPRDPAANRALEGLAAQLPAEVQRLEAGESGAADAILQLVADIEANIQDLPATTREALREFREVFSSSNLTAAKVAGMAAYRPWFGREVQYLSLQRAG